jgi:hypothetical protein
MQAVWDMPPARWAWKSKAAEPRSGALTARRAVAAGRALALLQLDGDATRQLEHLKVRTSKERVRAGLQEQPETEAELAVVVAEFCPAVAVPPRPAVPYLARLWDNLYGAAVPRSALESDMLRRLRNGAGARELMRELKRVS